MGLHRWVVDVERRWDVAKRRVTGTRTPRHFRIEAYVAHAGAGGVVVRGRVLDSPAPSEATAGEGPWAAARRTLRGFASDELAGVPLRVGVAGASSEVVTDDDGYFVARLHPEPDELTSPWTTGTVALAGGFRGLTAAQAAPVEVRVTGPGAAYGVISDVDDTVLVTGVQRVGRMIRQTVTGSALTRTAFEGAAELYRDLAGEANPVFYVSSSPWNLHAFLVAFLRHHGFPFGPLLLTDLLGSRAGRAQKAGRIEEILETNPDLPFVLIGDSGERDPAVYAEVVATHPGRVLAVYIREVRLDPADGRVEQVSTGWPPDVPFVLAADTDAMRRHATALGLL